MPLRFTPPHAQPPGTILSLLRRSYAALVEAEPGCWGRIAPKWAEFDREICAHPDTIGSCVFLSWADAELLGFGSYDPRPKPSFGIVGHNCILPAFRGWGYGAAQIHEILRRFREMGHPESPGHEGRASVLPPRPARVRRLRLLRNRPPPLGRRSRPSRDRLRNGFGLKACHRHKDIKEHNAIPELDH